jgi:hypothetical protein
VGAPQPGVNAGALHNSGHFEKFIFEQKETKATKVNFARFGIA